MLKILKEWLRIIFGLFVFAFGVHLLIFANIGLAPWDCLGMGISYHTPLSYGLSMTLIAIIVLMIDLILGEKIGFGTVFDALLCGNFTQFFNDVNPLDKNENLWFGIVIMIFGLSVMAIGMLIYMKGAQCCGPRDSLLVGLGKRMKKLPIGAVEIIIFAIVLACGRALGGDVGIGTVISTFGAGIVMQIIYSLLHFEPRSIVHRSVIEVVKEIKKDE